MQEDMIMVLRCFHSMFSISPKTCDKVKQFFTWPSKSTLIKERDNELMQAGLSETMLNYLNDLSILHNQPSFLALDEVYLKSYLNFDDSTGEIEGKADFDDFEQSKGNRKLNSNVSTHSLTFMISCPIIKVKLPISFFFLDGQVLGEDLEALIKSIISKLFTVNINITLVIFDQGSSNRKTFKKLCPDPDKTYFQLECKFNGDLIKKVVHVMFDVSHVFKAIRNNLINHNLKFRDENDNEMVADWKYITKTFFINKEQSISLIPKVKYKHINPTAFEKMKVN